MPMNTHGNSKKTMIPHRRKTSSEEDDLMRRRQQELRLTADYVAQAFQKHPEVLKVALIGSVARPLKKEVPRFRKFRRAGIAILHECKDLDLAVWLDSLDGLNELRRGLARSLIELFSDRKIGVAHHQVDVFILEPGTDRYRGRLCRFGSCPKEGKAECYVSGCGVRPFLRQHADFRFDPASVFPNRSKILFDRQSPSAGVQQAASPVTVDDDDIPF